MTWKILYLRLKAKNAQLRDCLHKKEMALEDCKGKERMYYDSYMNATDELVRLKEAMSEHRCQFCGQRIVVVGQHMPVRFCTHCGNVMKPFAIAVHDEQTGNRKEGKREWTTIL